MSGVGPFWGSPRQPSPARQAPPLRKVKVIPARRPTGPDPPHHCAFPPPSRRVLRAKLSGADSIKKAEAQAAAPPPLRRRPAAAPTRHGVTTGVIIAPCLLITAKFGPFRALPRGARPARPAPTPRDAVSGCSGARRNTGNIE